eukprot:1158726-Pelagomonas_calceolata.AAC.4
MRHAHAEVYEAKAQYCKDTNMHESVCAQEITNDFELGTMLSTLLTIKHGQEGQLPFPWTKAAERCQASYAAGARGGQIAISVHTKSAHKTCQPSLAKKAAGGQSTHHDPEGVALPGQQPLQLERWLIPAVNLHKTLRSQEACSSGTPESAPGAYI